MRATRLTASLNSVAICVACSEEANAPKVIGQTEEGRNILRPSPEEACHWR